MKVYRGDVIQYEDGRCYTACGPSELDQGLKLIFKGKKHRWLETVDLKNRDRAARGFWDGTYWDWDEKKGKGYYKPYFWSDI